MTRLEFCDKIYSIAYDLLMDEYKKTGHYILPSLLIAQAGLESGFNINAKTLFGIKGNGNALMTTEYINGKKVETIAIFKSYKNVAESIKGYIDLLTTAKRYQNILNNANFNSVAHLIYIDGYATDPNYSSKLKKLYDSYALARFDNDFLHNIKNLKINDITIGMRVLVSSYYASSTSPIEEAVIPSKYVEGTITKIVEGSHNPYLLNDGKIGWINKGDIRKIL